MSSWTTFLKQCHHSTYPDQSCWNWTGILVSKKILGSVLSRLPCCALMLSTRPPAHCETSGQPGQSGLPVDRMRRHLPIREAVPPQGLENPKWMLADLSISQHPMSNTLHFKWSPPKINLIHYFWGILYKGCSMYLFCNQSEIQM